MHRNIQSGMRARAEIAEVNRQARSKDSNQIAQLRIEYQAIDSMLLRMMILLPVIYFIVKTTLCLWPISFKYTWAKCELIFLFVWYSFLHFQNFALLVERRNKRGCIAGATYSWARESLCPGCWVQLWLFPPHLLRGRWAGLRCKFRLRFYKHRSIV